MTKKLLKYIVATAVASTAMIMLFSRKAPVEKFSPRDYASIIESGVLKAVAECNAISFYVEEGKVYGFDYEMLEIFAKEKGLKLEMTPEMSFEKKLKGVSEGRYDMIASETATTTQLKDSLLFTRPLSVGKQVLIQRKDNPNHIRSSVELSCKTIYIVKDSPAVMRLNNLMNETAVTIYVKEISGHGTEQLLAMVSAGDIDYAVCDETTAKAYIRNYDNLDMGTYISYNQFYSWGISKHSPVLLDSINIWLDRFMQTKEYEALYEKYINRKNDNTL